MLVYPKFEPQTALQIDRFRSVNEPDRAALVPAHVTLVFGLRNASLADLLPLCRAAATGVSETLIEFSSSEVAYDPFDDAHKLFLRCGKGKEFLTELHNRLYDGPHRAELRAEFPYRPHMTIATNANRSVVKNLSASDIGDLPIRATVGSLEVVELLNGKLNSVSSIPFVGSSGARDAR